ncbi:MAG: DUF2281 domain-containing protein [Caldilineaceae bacterium]|nr:DUF2281 domain-containing protein [Caldilineaceae bacterium]
MTMTTATVELTAIEKELIQLVRTLPPERVAQLVDFARFLAFQTTQGSNGWDEEEAAQEAALRADEERWDRLLSRPEAKALLRQMAQEAMEEYNTTMWDQQIEHDLEAGRLDTLLAEVDAEYEAGLAKSL